MTNLTDYLDRVKKRRDTAIPKLQGIFDVLKNQWGIAELKLRGTLLDQDDDLSKLIRICERQQETLEEIEKYSVGITWFSNVAKAALQAADEIASER